MQYQRNMRFNYQCSVGAIFVFILRFMLCLSNNSISKRNETCNAGFNIFDALRVSRKSVYCVYLEPLVPPKVNENMFGFGGDKYYMRDMVNFLTDLTKEMSYVGYAYVVIEDDSTLPVALITRLFEMKQPLLSHAHRINSAMKPNNSLVFIPDFHFIRTKGFQGISMHIYIDMF